MHVFKCMVFNLTQIHFMFHASLLIEYIRSQHKQQLVCLFSQYYVLLSPTILLHYKEDRKSDVSLFGLFLYFTPGHV